jgi:hypothetical protein
MRTGVFSYNLFFFMRYKIRETKYDIEFEYNKSALKFKLIIDIRQL